MTLSEKGFYGLGFAMSLFASVAVQKNVRDMARFKKEEPDLWQDPADPSVAGRFPGDAPQ